MSVCNNIQNLSHPNLKLIIKFLNANLPELNNGFVHIINTKVIPELINKDKTIDGSFNSSLPWICEAAYVIKNVDLGPEPTA